MINSLKDKIEHIEFDLTTRCNLQCKYCYLEHNPCLKKTDISPKIVDDFFTKLIKNNRIGQRIVYTFWGGEPFLNFDMIKYIVKNYGNLTVNQKPVECNYIIISNGTLINNEIADFCSENNLST